MTENVPPEKQRDEEPSEEETHSEPAGDKDIGPGGTPSSGGYEGLDPETDMPRMPSRPDAQDDE
ncbi:hypothetical protein BH20ACT19_BH20ACT19_09840 [soil metagenome]